MTHEERAKWITRGFLLFLAVALLTGAWFFPETKPKEDTAKEDTIKYDLEIFHYHEPGNPESEQIADNLNRVGRLYDKYVKVTRVDITAHPELAAAEKVTKPPKVVMMAGETRACKFQGVWTFDQIELKVREILRGLKRVGADWRPEVQGMQPGTDVAPVSPLKPVKP